MGRARALARCRPPGVASSASAGGRDGPNPTWPPPCAASARGTHGRASASIVTDFLSADGGFERPFAWETPLRRMAASHEVLVVEVVDPRELDLPDVGAVTFADPETGRRREIFTSDARLRRRYAETTAAHRAATSEAVRAARAGHVLLRTDRDWVRDLARHVNGRPMRRVPTGAA